MAGVFWRVDDLPIAVPGNHRICCSRLRKRRVCCAWEAVGGGWQRSSFVKFLLQVLGDRIPGRCNKTPGPSAAVGFPWGGLCVWILPSSLLHSGSFPRSWEACGALGCCISVAVPLVLTAPVPKTPKNSQHGAGSLMPVL